jgi:membrane protease YdiL (CAAX protease family)
MSESEDFSLVTKFVKKYEIIIFYLIAVSITWTGWFMIDSILIPLVDNGANFEQLIFEKGQYYIILVSLFGNISVFGPGIAAFIIIAVTDGRLGVKGLLKKIFNWRVAYIWYGIALLLPVLIKYGSFLFNDIFLGGSLSIDLEKLLTFIFVSVFIENLIPSGGQEEVGWTGFAQMRLQERYTVIQSTFIKVIMGWIWHLPLYLIFPWVGQYGGDIWLFLWYYIPIGFIYSWLFNNTDSILIPALLHASFNTVGIHLITSFTSNNTVVLTIIIMGLIMYLIVFLLFLNYGKNLTHKSLPSLLPRECSS